MLIFILSELHLLVLFELIRGCLPPLPPAAPPLRHPTATIAADFVTHLLTFWGEIDSCGKKLTYSCLILNYVMCTIMGFMY